MFLLFGLGLSLLAFLLVNGQRLVDDILSLKRNERVHLEYKLVIQQYLQLTQGNLARPLEEPLHSTEEAPLLEFQPRWRE